MRRLLWHKFQFLRIGSQGVIKLKTPRLLGSESDVAKGVEPIRTVILPITYRRKRKVKLFKSLFFALLLLFFVICVRLVFMRFFDEGEVYSATISTFFVEQGIALPK